VTPDAIRILMFDWGGTIVRVARQHLVPDRCVDAALAVLRDSGRACPPEAEAALRLRLHQHFSGADAKPGLREFDTSATLAHWAGHHGIPLPDASFLRTVVDALWQPWISSLDLLDRADTTLRRLVSRGYTLGLVSNCAAPPHICRQELNRLGIDELFAFHVFSSEVGYCKPHERIYARALSAARVHAPDLRPHEVLFIGDTPVPDVDGPAGHGLHTALVRTGRWDGSPGGLNHQPDLVLDSISCLPAALGLDAS